MKYLESDAMWYKHCKVYTYNVCISQEKNSPTAYHCIFTRYSLAYHKHDSIHSIVYSNNTATFPCNKLICGTECVMKGRWIYFIYVGLSSDTDLVSAPLFSYPTHGCLIQNTLWYKFVQFMCTGSGFSSTSKLCDTNTVSYVLYDILSLFQRLRHMHMQASISVNACVCYIWGTCYNVQHTCSLSCFKRVLNPLLML